MIAVISPLLSRIKPSPAVPGHIRGTPRAFHPVRREASGRRCQESTSDRAYFAPSQAASGIAIGRLNRNDPLAMDHSPQAYGKVLNLLQQPCAATQLA